MKKNILIILAFISISFAFTNCKKEVAGPKGDKGDKGEQGNVGVTGIVNTTLTANSWTWDNSSHVRMVQFNNVTSLTQNICENGVVMVYENYSSTWYPLPEIIAVPSSNITYNMTFLFTQNTLLVLNFLSDGTDPNPGITNFRLVVIPLAMIKPSVNIKNYSEVKEAYGLKD